MPAPVTVDDFLSMVLKSGVVDANRLTGIVASFQSAGEVANTPNEMADLLVREEVVTRFQVQNFLQGKFLGFVLGHYRILQLLGSGGMSAVYLCEDRRSNSRYALKVLPRSLAKDPIILKRFYREARASASLDHPNIVRGYDVGQEQNQHFFVMEHVDGPSLQDMVQKEGPLPIDRAIDYIRQSAVGLQHAYEQGLIHRDIKPGNLLVDSKGAVKILDMGLSRFANNDDSLLTRDVLGTLDYLAPEQAVDSHAVDIRADIYSLGGTFYFLLTGHSPLASDTLDPMMIARPDNKPRPIHQLRPEVPESLVAFIERMMAHDPQQRFPNPVSVANGLTLWQEGKEIPLPEPGPPLPTPTRQGPLSKPTAEANQVGYSNTAVLCWMVIGGCLLVLGIGVIVWWTLLKTGSMAN